MAKANILADTARNGRIAALKRLEFNSPRSSRPCLEDNIVRLVLPRGWMTRSGASVHLRARGADGWGQSPA